MAAIALADPQLGSGLERVSVATQPPICHRSCVLTPEFLPPTRLRGFPSEITGHAYVVVADAHPVVVSALVLRGWARGRAVLSMRRAQWGADRARRWSGSPGHVPVC